MTLFRKPSRGGAPLVRLALCLVGLAACQNAEGPAPPSGLYRVQPTPDNTASSGGSLASKLLILENTMGGTSSSPVDASPGLFEVGPPHLADDATRFLFVGRTAAEQPPALYEGHADGTEPRLLTAGNGAPAQPMYIPGHRVLYTDRVCPDGDDETPRAVYACPLDCVRPQRITFGAFRDELVDDLVTDSGHVKLRRWTAPGAEPLPLLMRPDGTGLSPERPLYERHDERLPPPPLPVPGWETLDAVTLQAKDDRELLLSAVDLRLDEGTLLVLNVYESRHPDVSERPRGSIRAAVLDFLPAPLGGPEPAPASSLRVPVQPDGSFIAEVPADHAFTITLFDEAGEVARCDAGLWVRPNERRGCVGCHEDTLRAPENHFPAALAGRERHTGRPANGK